MPKNIVDTNKDPVRLRSKELKNGNKSLYLDVYLDGVRKYEFLKLYLKPGKGYENKQANANTLSLANAIKAKRIVEIQNNKYGFSNTSYCSNADLFEYMIERAKRVTKHGDGTVRIAKCAVLMLKKYAKCDKMPFNRVDKKFVQGFSAFLKNTKSQYGKKLSTHTIHDYFHSFVASLNSAVVDEIIEVNPASKLRLEEKPEKPTGSRCYLTIEEIKKLYDTECKCPRLKQMFLFGCMCGLRLSDIMALRWKNLSFLPDGKVTLDISQVKTRDILIVPLSTEAIRLLPDKSGYKTEDYVFGKIGGWFLGHHLTNWVQAAGITKHVTFHVSRHTYATMLLTLGADLYTVSKLLGHANIKTTQLYAEVINQKKQDAVDLIPSFHKKE